MTKNEIITFTDSKLDAALEREVRYQLGKRAGEISVQEFNSLTTLWLDGNQLVSVDGLKLPDSLTTLWLDGNQLVSVDGLNKLARYVYGLTNQKTSR